MKGPGLLLAMWMLAIAPAAATSDLVDAIVAIVGGQPITLSDVRAASALGLVDVTATLDRATLVDRLVARELQRAEVERFSVALPGASAVSRRLAEVRARAGGTELSTALDRVGMSETRLRAWIEDDLRIERYVQQRFDTAAQPSDEEALIWFQSREREFARDGRSQPFAAVRDEVRVRLAAERRRSLLDDWVAGLRRRASIVVLPIRS